MSKFIPGKDALTLLNKRPFELFSDYVKKDLLRPHYNISGKPKPSPDISFKLTRLEESRKELELLRRRYSGLTMSAEERTSLAEGVKDPQTLLAIGYVPNLARIEHDNLEQKEKSLREELSKIDNTHSWKNYSLPESENEAKKVLNDLVDSLYIEEEVQKLKKNHDVEQKESQALDVPIEKGPEELTDLKEHEYPESPAFMQLIGEADNEINTIWKSVVKNARKNDKSIINSAPSDLQEDAIEAIENPIYTFKWVDKKCLEDANLFIETRDSSRPKRYFREHVLTQVIRGRTHEKDITISKTRDLLEKLEKLKTQKKIH